MAKRAVRQVAPPSQLAAFEKRLAETPSIEAGYLLRGEEDYFKRRALDALRKRAEATGCEVEVHDARDPDFDPQSLLGDLSTPLMFATGQLLVARGVDALLESKAKQPTPLVRALLAFLDRGEAGRSVALVVTKLRANHVLAKRFAEAGLPTLELRKLYDNPPPWKPDPRAVELVQWVQSRARELGTTLDPDGALYVAAATGNDLEAIDQQLERLRARGKAAGGVAAAIHWQAGGSPFAVADSLCRGDLVRSADGIAALFSGGMVGREGERVVDQSALTAILTGSLYRGVRQGLAAARATERGEDPAAAAGAPSDRARGELLERLRRRPASADWARMLADLAEVERRAKSGAGADAADFARLALRWAVRGAPARR